MEKVLMIDDEQAVLNFLTVLLAQSDKFEPESLNDSTLAYQKLKEGKHDLLLLDMDMPNVTGLDILSFIKENSIDIETIVLTGVDDVELAVSAMKAGAYDYLRKPVDNDLLILTMERALERKSMRREIASLKKGAGWEAIQNKKVFEEIVTQHPRMIQIFRFVEKIAPTNTSVLIMGESGTGKELIARALHKVSKRADKPFIAVNAGAFARDLFASEFFGHIKGAFSGAITDKKGFLEEADQGTLFLDEIGELPMDLQVKLLRVLQNGEYFKVGSTKPRHSDVKLIAATNKNPWEEIDSGSFRKDLFYRLNVNTISLPALKERVGDIEILSYHFLRIFNQQNGKNIYDITDEVIEILSSYDFPGNIRELENIINSAAVIEQTNTLTLQSLPVEFLDLAKKHPNPDNITKFQTQTDLENPMTLEEMEVKHIKKVLEMTDGNRSQAAKILGITRVTLISKIKKYGFEDFPSK
jgi:DNA-binding NtrC family response regulator